MKNDLVTCLVVLGFVSLLSSCGSLPTNSGSDPLTSNQKILSSGFEAGAAGWENLVVDSSEYFSPVEGESYATAVGGEKATHQKTGIVVASGHTYTVTVWSLPTRYCFS